ncbi:MAG: 2-amino-4-hydroxy-6-hydroxymethyldihydropteridine diphosphokinase [Planctomycetota bacterium]|jgi:2-amino-4-hydroxy-6-hydroxymethyldihydropteridine diphosphokinase
MAHDGDPICYLALGSNLGDRLANLTSALNALQADPRLEVVRRSGLYETTPVGGPADQRLYLNAVIGMRTSLSPGALLKVCQNIERRAGRRRGEPNSPRTIDIDLLLCGEHVCEGSCLTLPHPRMHLRRFVLEPFNDIAPDVVHPVLARSVHALLAELEPASVTGQICVRLDEVGWDQ